MSVHVQKRLHTKAVTPRIFRTANNKIITLLLQNSLLHKFNQLFNFLGRVVWPNALKPFKKSGIFFQFLRVAILARNRFSLCLWPRQFNTTHHPPTTTISTDCVNIRVIINTQLSILVRKWLMYFNFTQTTSCALQFAFRTCMIISGTRRITRRLLTTYLKIRFTVYQWAASQWMRESIRTSL